MTVNVAYMLMEPSAAGSSRMGGSANIVAEKIFGQGLKIILSTLSNLSTWIGLTKGPDSLIVSGLKVGVATPFSIFNGCIQTYKGVSSCYAATQIGDREGIALDGAPSALQGFFTTASTVSSVACRWLSSIKGLEAATSISEAIVSPILLAVSTINLLVIFVKLKNVLGFEDALYESIGVQKQLSTKRDSAVVLSEGDKSSLLHFFKTQLDPTEKETQTIYLDVSSAKNQARLRKLCKKADPKMTEEAVEKKLRVMMSQDLQKRLKNAQKVKKEAFERRASGECREIIEKNLEFWEKDVNGKADSEEGMTLSQAFQKTQETLLRNKAILCVKIALAVVSISIAILLMICPGAFCSIGIVFLVLGIIGLALDVSGFDLWKKIKSSHEAQVAESDEKIFLPQYSYLSQGTDEIPQWARTCMH